MNQDGVAESEQIPTATVINAIKKSEFDPGFRISPSVNVKLRSDAQEAYARDSQHQLMLSIERARSNFGSDKPIKGDDVVSALPQTWQTQPRDAVEAEAIERFLFQYN